MNKELKNRIYGEYSKAWDARMADFCTKQLWDAIDVNGKLVVGKKPDLQSEFYFGYSDCGQGLSYEENNARIEAYEDEKKRYFLEKNIKPIEDIIDNLINCPFVYVYKKVYGDTPLDLYNLHFARFDVKYEGLKPYRGLDIEYILLTKDERETVLKMYYKILEKQTKRIINYYTRFNKKISFNSYWIDR